VAQSKDHKKLIELLEATCMSKKQSLLIADWMLDNQSRVDLCWSVIKQEEEPLYRRAAYALDNFNEKSPLQAQHLIPELIDFLPQTKSNPLRRHLTRILSKNPLPKNEDLQGLLAECCFNFLVDAQVDVAVKAHCIDLIFRLCKIYPELEVEFHSVLHDQMEKNTTAFKARARQILSGKYRVKEPKI